MSLIYTIKTRRFEDILNQGARIALTGIVPALITDGVIQPGGVERNIVVTGWALSSSSNTDVLVSLGFKVSGKPTVAFASAYVKSGSSMTMIYPLGDERYGDSAGSLVITTNGGPVVYTINGRIIAEKVGLGYIQRTDINGIP